MERTTALRPTTAAAAAAVVAFGAGTLLAGDGGRDAALAADVGVFVAALAAVLACLVAGVRAAGRTRRAWLVVGAGAACWSGGELAWLLLEVSGRVAPFPSAADVGNLAAVPLVFLGVTMLPGTRARAALRFRLFLDGLVMAASLLLVGWVVVLRPVVAAGADSSLDLMLAVAYPVSDLVLVAAALTAFARSQRGARRGIFLVAAALGSMAVADAAFAVLQLGGGYASGHPIDTLWVAGYLCLAVAAREPAPAASDERDVQLTTTAVLLPYPPFLVATAVTFAPVVRGARLDVVQVATLALLFGVLLVRQLVTSLDNTSLAARLSGALVELQGREEHFRSLVQGSSDVITICDEDGTIRFSSPSVERIFGYPPDDLVGRPIADFVHPDDVRRVRRDVARVVSGRASSVTLECRYRHRNGGWRDVEAVLSNQLATPSVGGLVFNTRDVSERRELEHQLSYQAFHDPLTGLANRSLFRDRVRHALALRSRTRQPVAVLFLDLDGFKSINDSLGHAAGDRLLALTAERLAAAVRPGDTVARLGGDEFAVLLEDIEDLPAARQIASRFLSELSAPFVLDGHEVFVNASIGLAQASPDVDADELLRNADLAMYRAKSLGKGRCETFEPALHAAVVRRLETEVELRRALVSGELSLYYQPILDLTTDELVGVEALLRWVHPSKGVIGPTEFISVAEDSGLIVPIGRWVLQQAARQVCRWERESGRALRLAVNISARQLQAPRLAEHVAKVLRTTGLPADRLVLEITESMLVDDADRTIAKLHLLRELGVRLAVDDFGTGYSSLNYLRRLPVDILKIDRSFVSGVGTEHELTALTSAIVALGRELGLDVVAEGIEDAGQLAALTAMGCRFGQGFLFARPLPARDLLALLRPPRLPASAAG